jgi:hypothetical protein
MTRRPKVEILTSEAPPVNGDAAEPATFANDAPLKKKAHKVNGKPAPHDEPRGNFFNKLAQLTPEEWDRHRVYIYRRWPRISKTGEPHYVGVYREAIDEEFIKSHYGSGRYLLKLNNQRTTIDQAPLEIMDLASPPRVSPDETVDCAENEKFHKLWPAAAEKKPADGNGEGGAVKELVGLLKTVMADRTRPEHDDLQRTLTQWALQETSREREQNGPGGMAALLSTLKGMTPAAPPPPDLVSLINGIKSLQPDPLTLIEKLRSLERKTAEAPPSPLASVKETVELFTQVRDLFKADAPAAAATAAAREDAPWWETVIPNIGPTLNAVAGFWATVTNARHAQAAPGAAPGAAPTAPASGFDPYRDATRMREYARQQNAEPAAASTAPSGAMQPSLPATPTPPPQAAPVEDPGVAQILNLLNSALGAMHRGIDGHTFADSLIVLNGDLVYANLVGQIKTVGVPVAIQFAKQLPELGAQVSAFEAPLAQFIEEFMEGPAWDDDEGAEKNAA